jgi:hypothetical protein
VSAERWAILAAFLVTGTGVLGLVLAGRREAAGRLLEARLAARRSGFVAGAGSVAVGMLAFGLTIPVDVRFAVVALMLGCGATSLLAGLSGKPRPSAAFAVVLFVAAAILILAAIPSPLVAALAAHPPADVGAHDR